MEPGGGVGNSDRMGHLVPLGKRPLKGGDRGTLGQKFTSQDRDNGLDVVLGNRLATVGNKGHSRVTLVRWLVARRVTQNMGAH